MRRDFRIVGREDELVRLRQLFEPDGPTCAVIDGEAGIGKTTLWRHAVEHAPPSWSVLAARPAENEASLPYAALGDLLEPLLDSDGPEADVLEPALQRGDTAEPAGRLTVSRAALALLRRTAEASPILVAVDDVQWLDAPSAEVLEFVFRRIDDTAIRILVARRADDDAPPPLGLDRAPLRGGVDELRMRSLDADEIGAILIDQLRLRLTRPRLVELHAACSGNPFYALEIGRAVLTAGPADDSRPLPIPDRGALVRHRLDALSSDARSAVLLAAASLQPSPDLLRRAAEATTGLDEAVGSGVLVLDGSRIRFAHPLLASATYAAATPWARRDAHTRLAAAAADRLERAHHLDRASIEADEAVAAELAAAAAQAEARGAPAVAARLLERAAELTPGDDEEARRRRLLDSVPHHLAAGDPTHGREILEGLTAAIPAGPERSDLLLRIAELGLPIAEAIRVCHQALEEAPEDAAIGARHTSSSRPTRP